MPGSPVCHAASTIRSNTSRACRRPAPRWVPGWIRSYESFALTASMNASVTPTERLKFSSASPACLASMNSRISGCVTRGTPMLAPRRRPPSLMFSVAQSNTRMNETGPDASPPVEPTTSPRGRRCEKEKPVPPPVRWTRAIARSPAKIDSMLSSTGTTKQAAS